MFTSVGNVLVRGISRNLNLARSAHHKVNNYLRKTSLSPQIAFSPTLPPENSPCLPSRILPQCKIELPSNKNLESILEFPNYSGIFSNLIDKLDPTPMIDIKEPSSEHNIEKQAARLIVIRRRKMKKHKLRKLRIRMKFEWAKIRQKREMKKEKAFQAVLIAQIKEAEAFDPAEYVQEKLKKVNMIDSENNKNKKPLSHDVSK